MVTKDDVAAAINNLDLERARTLSKQFEHEHGYPLSKEVDDKLAAIHKDQAERGVKNIYVVTWEPKGGVGGFEWRRTRSDARVFRHTLLADGDTDVRIDKVEVPEHLSGEALTDWLDKNWYDR